MKSVFVSLFLLVTVLGVTKTQTAAKVYNCASCLMPCRNTARASLTKLFSSSVDSYTITSILDGYNANFQILISHNGTEHRIYSARIHVKYWLLSSLCRILSETPVLSHFSNDTSRISVQFPSFRRVETHLQSQEEYLTSMFLGRVGYLQNELSATNKQLTALSREFEERVEMQPKLKYAIYYATITGNSLMCLIPNPMKYPSGDKFCRVIKGDWIYFDLQDTYIINLLLFRLWDQDARVYTYNLSISTDGITWMSIASGRKGQSLQEIRLDEPTHVRYIKMEGYSTAHDELHLCAFAVDWI